MIGEKEMIREKKTNNKQENDKRRKRRGKQGERY